MEYTQEMLRELAEHIYDLDAEVYTQLGSSLGRVFNRDREGCVEDMVRVMNNRTQAHKLRSELALISNMARTIQDKEIRKMVMREYNNILQQVISLPTSFGEGDVLDKNISSLNALNLKERFTGNDHMIICISRTYGSGANEIGFTLADTLKINYYDAEIFSEVLKRLEAEKDVVEDRAGYSGSTRQKEIERAFAAVQKMTFKDHIKQFSRYHGLSKRDAVFFNQSDLISDMAKNEDFIVMGRCADMILTNKRIPHISIFITAPFEQRIKRIMDIDTELTVKQAQHLLKRIDKHHKKYYNFYTGREWGNAINYDLCINSSAYGIEGSVEFILKMIKRDSM